MKKRVLSMLLIFSFAGCRKNFPETLAKAQASFAENNYVNAIDIINNGLDDWKDDDGADAKARAYEILGASYHKLRNTDKAEDAYRQAVKISDKAFDAAYALGNLYLTKNDPERAERSFRDALRMKPNDPLALLGLGNSYFAQQKNADAIAAFENVLNVSPGVRDAMESLASLKQRASAKPVKVKRSGRRR